MDRVRKSGRNDGQVTRSLSRERVQRESRKRRVNVDTTSKVNEVVGDKVLEEESDQSLKSEINMNELRCEICSDKALGHNFNAVSCESCKAFFRRNALRSDVNVCSFNKNCDITVLTRKFCPHCRLVKCFKKGMRKDLIHDEKKKQKRKRISKNITPSPKVSRKEDVTDEDNSNIEQPSPPESSKLVGGDFINHSKSTPSEISKQSSESTSSTTNASSSISILKDQCEKDKERIARNRINDKLIPDFSAASPDNLDAIIQIAIDAEFHVNDRKLMDEQTSSSVLLNDSEMRRINELFEASRSLVEPLDLETRHQNFDSGDMSLISVINLTDLAIRRVIRMANRIESFVTLCQSDQIALLKGGCSELMILRSTLNYNPDKDSWQLPSMDNACPRELKLDFLKEASSICHVDLYAEHKRFILSLDTKWRTDETAMLILSAILLFSPNRNNVVHKDVIKLEQDTYYFLLRRYINSVVYQTKQKEEEGRVDSNSCSSNGLENCDSRRIFLHLIDRLNDLHRINESHIKLLLEVNPKLVEPLLIEIFDLNNQNPSNNNTLKSPGVGS